MNIKIIFEFNFLWVLLKDNIEICTIYNWSMQIYVFTIHKTFDNNETVIVMGIVKIHKTLNLYNVLVYYIHYIVN